MRNVEYMDKVLLKLLSKVCF